MRKNAEVPIAKVEATEAFEPGPNHGAQNLLGRGILIESGADGVELCGPHRLPHDFGIQTCFVSEVIINSGDVGAGTLADLPDGGLMKPQLGEHFSSSVNQTRARLIAGDRLTGGHRTSASQVLLCWHSNDNLKRSFESVKRVDRTVVRQFEIWNEYAEGVG